LFSASHREEISREIVGGGADGFLLGDVVQMKIITLCIMRRRWGFRGLSFIVRGIVRSLSQESGPFNERGMMFALDSVKGGFDLELDFDTSSACVWIQAC